MPSFRTEINCSPTQPIELHHNLITMGSCFADQLGAQLKQNKFPILVNPFGTCYNPISIHQLLIQAWDENLDDRIVTERDGYWYHHDYHSQFTATSREALITQLREQQQAVKKMLMKADVLLVTYGTAWIYELKPDNRVVSNCHKVPAAQFTKRLLSVAEIVDSFHKLFERLKSARPSLRIIMTVSPVRHIKDTLELNSVSKSVLRLAAHEVQQLPEVDYFPAYELVLDDLRDYRFYQRDLIHPSDEARDYVYEKFSNRYLTDSTRKLIATLQEIQRALNHKPFQIASAAHQKFLHETILRLESIQDRIPVQAELEQVRRQLNTHG